MNFDPESPYHLGPTKQFEEDRYQAETKKMMDESCCPIVDIIRGQNSKNKSQKYFLGRKIIRFKTIHKVQNLEPKKEKK
jgi:hypothetical protein